MKTAPRKILIALLILLLLIQFIPMDKANPPVEATKGFISITQPPDAVEKMLRAACYDCHSHETKYPWYSRVQPIGWWLRGHVREGVEHLNFSLWSDYSESKRSHKVEESIELIEDKHMPLKSYTWTHADARLSEADIQMLNSWLVKQQ